MEFIVQNSGFLLGILLIIILAIIGYYADKKDSKNKSAIDNSNNSVDDVPVKNVDNNSNYSSESIDESFKYNINDSNDSINDSFNLNDGFIDNNINEINNEYLNNNSDNSNFVDGLSNNVASVSSDLGKIDQDISIQDNQIQEKSFDIVSDNISSGLNNVDLSSNKSGESTNLANTLYDVGSFENLDMSLEDLEKKNYNEIASNTSNDVDSDNYYYSNIDNERLDDLNNSVSDINIPTNQEELSNENVSSVLNSDENLSDSANELVVDNDSLNSADESITNGDLIPDYSVQNQDDSLSFDNVDNLDSDADDYKHNFDNEIEEVSSSDSSVEDESTGIDYSQNDMLNSPIPEIYGFQDTVGAIDQNQGSQTDNDSTINLDNNSIDEDIWKF